MNQAEIKEELREMKGKTFLYRGETITFETFDIKHDVFVLKFSNHDDIKKAEEQMPGFIELLKNNYVDTVLTKTITAPIRDVVKVEKALNRLESQIANQNDKMFDLIDEMINKVKDDPSYVPQASMVNDLLKTKIEATKTAILASKI